MSEREFREVFGMEEGSREAVPTRIVNVRRKSESEVASNHEEASKWRNMYDYGNVTIKETKQAGQKKRCRSAPTKLLTRIIEQSGSGSGSAEKLKTPRQNVLKRVSSYFLRSCTI